MKIKDYIKTLRPGQSFEPIDCLDMVKSPVEVCEDFTFLMDSIERGNIKRLPSGTLIRPLNPYDGIVVSSRDDNGNKYPLEDFIHGIIDKIDIGSFFSQEDISKCYNLPTSDSRRTDILDCLQKYAGLGAIRKVNYSDEYLYEKIQNSNSHYNELQRLFIDFLVENKCYNEFIYEISRSNEFHNTFVYRCIANLLNGQLDNKAFGPLDWISKSFLWNKSKSGWKYWREMNLKWLKKLALFINPNISDLIDSMGATNNIIDEYAYVEKVANDMLCNSKWRNKWYLYSDL